MSNLSYKGTAVAVTAAGIFTADHKGVKLSAPSFSALKKRIDEAGAFQPFDGFREVSGYQLKTHEMGKGAKVLAKMKDGSAIILVRVVGIDRRKESFVTDPAAPWGGEVYHVMRDTPDNRAAWITWKDHEIERDRIKEALQKKATELHGKIAVARASEMLK